MESGSIRPISADSVHKICSGQVVLTLATAVKELVENSLDAGATIIEVRLKEYGSELIEVVDNGKGVKESDFQAITLKHHTSKINDFCDVQFVSTFGFRGEALSSLCALSNVEITTCHSDATMGTLLMYDRDGTLTKSSPTHRQVGTTVTLRNLFHTLPVRHKEFIKNLRREYTKMMQLLTAYCLISINHKITCTNVTGKGKKSIVLSTHSGSTVKDNIACIFGSKQADDLLTFVQHLPEQDNLEEYSLTTSALKKCDMYRLEGFVSSCIHGEGRSSSDRQFFYVDGRPCDMPKVSKLLNEVYHQFNKAQYPFVLLNIITQSGSADVNVTPDKRQIFVQEEKLLLCILKVSILRMYQPLQSKVAPSILSFCTVDSAHCQAKPSTSLAAPIQNGDSPERASKEKNIFTSPKDGAPFQKELVTPMTLSTEVVSEEAPKRKFLKTDGSTSPPTKIIRVEKSNEVSVTHNTLANSQDSSPVLSQSSLTLKFNDDRGTPCLASVLRQAYRGKALPFHRPERKINQFLSRFTKAKEPGKRENLDSIETCSDLSTLNTDCLQTVNKYKVHLDEPCNRKRKMRTIMFNMDELRGSRKLNRTGPSMSGATYRRFRSRISPAENASAEQELSREIRKEDFSDMCIVGQFNLGFIVCRLHDDLFIVDQHATDEKYHYEMMRRDEVVDTQPLVNPQLLKLTATSECVLLDHLAIFEKSGFRFLVNDQGSVGNRVSLTSVPVDHSCTFGKEDVDEMIFMLSDNPVTTVRPSRVNRLFASRACRKSVMIGTALTHSHMKKLLVHMGEMEQPWNCPHGRPTIRHLFHLSFTKTIDPSLCKNFFIFLSPIDSKVVSQFSK